MVNFRMIFLMVYGIHLGIGLSEELDRGLGQVKSEFNFNFARPSVFADELWPKKNIRTYITNDEKESKKSPSQQVVSRSKRNDGLGSYGRESKPHFLFTPIVQTVSPGSPVSIKCSAAGFPDPVLSWMRDGTPLIPSQRMAVTAENYGREVVSYVNISNAITRDGGLFSCIASNKVGTVTYSTRLNVYGPPFVRPMKNVTAVAGKSAHVWCPAGGYPVPALTWQFQGKELKVNSKYNFLGNNTLVIRDATLSDQGRYSCIASGRRGTTVMAEALLQIINPPEIEKFMFNQELVEGKRTSLTCMVTSGDLPISIRWLKNNQPLPHDPHVKQHLMGDYSKALLFEKLAERHSGEYTCTASNSAASSKHTATLLVKVPPKFLSEPSDLSVGVGSSVRLECNVKGIPKPQLTWSKSETGNNPDAFKPLLMSNENVIIEGNSLVFGKVQKIDAGAYKCEASNGIGKAASRVIRVSVNAGAIILTKSKTVTGHLNRDVTMECEVFGDQPLTITWKKDYSIVVTSQRTPIKTVPGTVNTIKSILQINQLQPFDKGAYTCEAKNNHGRQSRKFTLEIYEPPSSPKGIVVESVSSRTAHISWKPEVQSDVILNYKEVKDGSWNNRGQNISIQRTNSFYVLQSLNPFSRYDVRLYGRNDLGVSSPSKVVSFVTLEEVPSAPPTDVKVEVLGSHSLYVKWSAPFQATVNGKLRGYQIAVKEQNLVEGTVYITRPVTSNGGTEEYIIRDLKSNKLYEISVRAFNMVGVGPLSSPRVIQKTKMGVPACRPVGIACRSDSPSTVRVWWQIPSSNCQKSSIQDYSILGIATHYPIQSLGSRIPTGSHSHEVITTNLEKTIGNFYPSTNVTIYVRGLNNYGYSSSPSPVFCTTQADVPSKVIDLRALSPRDGPAFVSWRSPVSSYNEIIRYTIYYEQNGKVSSTHVVQDSNRKTWKHLHGFKNGDRVVFWVTATSVSGESEPSSRVPLRFSSPTGYGPIALASPSAIRTAYSTGITMECAVFGSPPPKLEWRLSGKKLLENDNHQFLPGSDLHVIATRSSNFTCRATNSGGMDESTIKVTVVQKPSPPILRVLESSRSTTNISVKSDELGGSPILGYTIYYKISNGEWLELIVPPNRNGEESIATIRNLQCATNLRIYSTSWNAQGTSLSSQISVASTKGSYPSKPSPTRIIEVNSTCIIFRLYEWPENECAIYKWKIEHKLETEDSWDILHDDLRRDIRDIPLCDIEHSGSHFVRLTAFIYSGKTSVAYNINFRVGESGLLEPGPIEEISLRLDEKLYNTWLDAHIIAGIISAILLTVALAVCSFVLYQKRSDDKKRKTGSSTSKTYDASNLDYEIYQHHFDKNIPYVKSIAVHKKKSRGSIASYEGFSEEDIYPYATFSTAKAGDTLQYGITVRSNSPTTRNCYEGVSRDEAVYGSGKDPYFTSENISKRNNILTPRIGTPFGNSDQPLETLPMTERQRAGRQKKHKSKNRTYGEIETPPLYPEARRLEYSQDIPKKFMEPTFPERDWKEPVSKLDSSPTR